MYFVIYIKNIYKENKKKMCSKDLIEDRPILFQLKGKSHPAPKPYGRLAHPTIIWLV